MTKLTFCGIGDEPNTLPPDVWPICDHLFMSKELHNPENRKDLIENETHLYEWSEKVYASNDTREIWERVVKKREFK